MKILKCSLRKLGPELGSLYLSRAEATTVQTEGSSSGGRSGGWRSLAYRLIDLGKTDLLFSEKYLTNVRVFQKNTMKVCVCHKKDRNEL